MKSLFKISDWSALIVFTNEVPIVLTPIVLPKERSKISDFPSGHFVVCMSFQANKYSEETLVKLPLIAICSG